MGDHIESYVFMQEMKKPENNYLVIYKDGSWITCNHRQLPEFSGSDDCLTWIKIKDITEDAKFKNQGKDVKKLNCPVCLAGNLEPVMECDSCYKTFDETDNSVVQ